MADAKKPHQKAANFWEKFADVQSKMAVKRDKKGAHNARYRDLNAILDVVKPALAEHKLCLVFHESFDGPKVISKAWVTDGEESIDAFGHAAIEENQRSSLGQRYGAATTYARRYAVEGLFAICETPCIDDVEAEQAPAVKSRNKKTGTATKSAVKAKSVGAEEGFVDAPTEQQLTDAKQAYRKLASDYELEFSQVLLYMKEELGVENWSDIKTYKQLQDYYLQVKGFVERNGTQPQEEGEPNG